MSQLGWFTRCLIRRHYLLHYLLFYIPILLLIAYTYRQHYPVPVCFCTKTGTVFNVSKHLNNIIPRQSNLIRPGERLIAWNGIASENSFNLLPRPTIGDTREGIMKLLQDFMDLLQQHEIEFFMSQGMLLGSYFFHDIIPWDDDIDLMVHIRDVNKLRAMFRKPEVRAVFGAHSFHDPVNVYGDGVIWKDIPMNDTISCLEPEPYYEVCYQQGKIYRQTSPHAGKYEWRYPFVDFIFYATNATHMYNHEMWSRDGKIEIPLENFYPFHLRPFNRLWFPAPRRPIRFLRSKFTKEFQCKQGVYNHSQEFHIRFRYSTDCSLINDCYAHVRRRQLTDTEKLQLFSPAQSQRAKTGEYFPIELENDQYVDLGVGHPRPLAKRSGDTRFLDKGVGDNMSMNEVGDNPGVDEKATKHKEVSLQTGFDRSQLGVVEELVLAGQVIQSVVLEEEYESRYDLSFIQ